MKGVYVVGYLETTKKKFLISVSDIRGAVFKICKCLDLMIVGEKYHVFNNPGGITYCFILSQSHFIVHTWPEEHKIFFDIFTCGKEINIKKCAETLSKEFKGNVKKIKKMK